MIKKNHKIIITLFVCMIITAIVATIAGKIKYNLLFESKQYTLTNLYAMISGNINSYISKNEDLLNSWKYIISDGKYNDEDLRLYIDDQKNIWKFDTFYFMNEEGDYITSEGEKGTFENNYLKIKAAAYAGKRSVVRETSPDGKKQDLYISPLTGTYNNFEFDAIGIGIDMNVIKLLLTNGEYARSSNIFMVDEDGYIIFSSLSEDKYDNIYTYVENASFSSSDFTAFKIALTNKGTDVEVIEIDNKPYYLCFQPINYDDYMLVVLDDKNQSDADMDGAQVPSTILQAVIISVLALSVLLLLYQYRNIERKRQEGEIKYREIGYNSLVGNTNNAIIMLDLDKDKPDFVSESVHWAFGLRPDEIRGNYKLLEELVIEDTDKTFIRDAKNIEVGGYRNKNIKIRNNQTNEIKTFDLGILRSDLAEMEGKCVLAFVDKTDEIKKEKEMNELLDAAQNANATKSQFLVNMSHIFRTPMNAIGGYIELINKNINNKDKTATYVDKLKISYEDMLGLVNSLLEMSKNASGDTLLDISEFDISEAVAEAISAIEYTARGQNIIVEAKRKNLISDRYMGDSGKLVEVLKSVLSNAVKYNRNNGHVWINVVGSDETADGYQEIDISVKDDGFGMDEETLKHLFEPFSVDITNSPEKMKHKGMSLLIAKSIIDVMGGTISAESKIDEGTAFYIKLKLQYTESHEPSSDNSIWINEDAYKEDKSENKETDKNIRTDISGLNILVVEDNEVNAEILMDMLSFSDAHCEYAEDGVVADEIFEKSEPGHFDIILMDLMMPNRDGYEAVKVIRSMKKEDAKTVPILAVSANSYSDDIEKCYRAGMNGHVSKPVDFGKLEEEIIKAVNM
ncbi:MAG: response regulator [Butyrivibrio sp.]|nr:response regulator [Butyrivibrio sp.]